MKTIQITLTNSFHDSEVTLRAKVLPNDTLELSKGQVRRARSILCGIESCTCGGTLGDRPPTSIMGSYDDGSVTIPASEVS